MHKVVELVSEKVRAREDLGACYEVMKELKRQLPDKEFNDRLG